MTATWQRSTTRVTFEDIPVETMAAIREYLDERAGIPGVLEAVTDLWRTSSHKKGGLLKKAQQVTQTVALGPQWLLLIVHDGGRAVEWADVKAIRLGDIRVQDYETSSLAALQADSGVTISWQAGGPDPSSTFLGLGSEAAADELRARLHASPSGA